jgi:aerobic carbon-monoxide dehydrogenase medium subunit
VYPARFEYTAPSTLEEVIATLSERGDEAKVLAGGQSLIPLMKLRFATPGVLVDLNGVPDLDYIEEREGELCIGALVRHKTCEKSELLRGRYRVLGDAAPQISDPLVRNRGTVCGSLAHADPQGDWGAVMLTARARASSQEGLTASGRSPSTISPTVRSRRPSRRTRRSSSRGGTRGRARLRSSWRRSIRSAA